MEFEAVKGQGVSGGGFSLDDINLSETVCPHHVWHIRDFGGILQSVSGKQWSNSPRFYSSEGYGFQIIGLFQPGAFGVFFRLASGANDDNLQWPCLNRQITFQLLEQRSSILQRMSKQLSWTLSTTQNFTSESWPEGTSLHPSVTLAGFGDIQYTRFSSLAI